MEKEMRELYVEGVAIHGGPEPCGGVCEGAGEASAGVRVGWAPLTHVERFSGEIALVDALVDSLAVSDAVTFGARWPRSDSAC